MPDQSPDSSDSWLSSRRYLLNLGLFSVSVILVTVWFHVHLSLYVTEARLVGGTLTLWGLWKIAQSAIKRGIDDQAPKVSRILASPGLTEYLGLGLAIVIVLYAMTSSVYLEYRGAPRGESEFKVDVLHKGNPYLETLAVASYDQVAGRPFFFRFNTIDLLFDIQEPRGYQAVARKLAPWSSVRLRVPQDFTEKKFHVVRLVPGRGLFNLLPRAGDEVETSYYLRATVGGGRYANEDLRRGGVLVGAEEKDLRWVMENREPEKSAREIEEYFTRQSTPADRAREIATEFESHTVFLATAEFAPGDSVSLVVGRLGDAAPLLVLEFTVTDAPGVQTIFLEVTK